MSQPTDHFQLEWHGEALVIIPAGNIESLNWEYVEQAAELVLVPLRRKEVPLAVFDLERAPYFGSVFLALLLRSYKLVKLKGGEMVLCNVGRLGRDLLSTTCLDTLWAVYETREQALEAIGA